MVESLRYAARNHHVPVVATFLEAADPKPFNSALLIDPTGQIALHHWKVHICSFDNPESGCGRGKDFRVAEIHGSAAPVQVGLMKPSLTFASCKCAPELSRWLWESPSQITQRRVSGVDSFAVDPVGKVITIADESPSIAIANFDLALIRRVRLEDHARWRV